MSFWQIKKLLPALAQSASPDLTGTKSDQRLDNVKTAAGRVAPRIQEAHQPANPVVRFGHEVDQDRQSHQRRGQQMVYPRAAHEKHEIEQHRSEEHTSE